MAHKISIIIPCYFNEENIPITTKKLQETEKIFNEEAFFEYVFIDDGSEDNTLKKLIEFKYSQKKSDIKIIKLTGNFGSYNAISAGLNYATGDCNVVLSADLQDPPELIKKMYDYWKLGNKLVIANRNEREDPFFNKIIANFFHKLVKAIAIKNIPKGGFDFVLFDKKILDEIKKMDHQNTHLFYLISSLKYDYVSISYKRLKRTLGKSRWTFSKKVKLFIDTFVGFSYVPLRMISLFGFIFGLMSIAYSIYIVFNKLRNNIAIEGWSSLMMVVLFVSSFQMISIGILGEYLWRTLDSSRKRPNYIIEKII